MLLLAACPRGSSRPIEPVTAMPAEGIAISMYASGSPASLVDDRRWVEVKNGTIVLDRIDPAADLPAMLVEPLDRQRLALGTCVRERIDRTPGGLDKLVHGRPAPKPGAEVQPRTPAPPPSVLSPVVRCRVDGPGGRRFVRVLHVAPTIVFRVNHVVMVTDGDGDEDRAVITTRFAITTPSWGTQRAQVTLHDRAPGGEQAARAIAHGQIVLDGTIPVLVEPERKVPAHVRTVFDGAIRVADMPATDPGWGRESRRLVQTVLDLENLQLPPGPFDVRIAAPAGTRDVMVAATGAEKIGAHLRLTLWPDNELHGMRRNSAERFGATGKQLVQRLQLSVANASEVPRDVWIEERLRPARRREITGVRPEPTIADDIARMRVVVPPRGTQQVNLTIRYEL